jgi:Domain of unknown function (DUF4168)
MIHSVFNFGMRNFIWPRSLTVGTIAMIALLSGVTPNLAGSKAQLLSTVASAQADESAMTRYVRAALEIEKTRRSMVSQVKEMTQGDMPSNVCQPGSIAQLQSGIRDRVKGICDNFRAQADAIVKKHKLSREEFNNFQKRSQEPDLRNQIEAEIRRLGL